MQICSNPLRVVRSVRPDDQWCVTLPAGYPSLFPYRPSNVEYDGGEVFTNDSSKMKASSMSTNNQLIRRLQQNNDPYQTSSTNNIRQDHLRSFTSSKQRASNGNRSERVNRNR